ncbi:adenylyl-sulfate kinase [Paenibacillus koleovorans]|uniref:adenylyl-sulfate kinase n=1 Tax=Paenibacillus koleovorans TaxID=121608 RepID=UPI001FE450D3|nr:adenylyl-sulfate kinase [Paenibacillus koleovorans]
MTQDPIVWHPSTITRQDRNRLNGHRSGILWLTGLSGAGKSTLAYELEKQLHGRGCRTYVLDGDNVRHGLNRNLGFSPEDRSENIRRVAEVAKLFVDAGFIAIVALISPVRLDRQAARALFQEGEFLEVYVKCPIEECERRDPKGLYKKARAGELKGFTGIDAPYEPPLKPEIVVESSRHSPADGAAQLIELLGRQYFLIPPH